MKVCPRTASRMAGTPCLVRIWVTEVATSDCSPGTGACLLSLATGENSFLWAIRLPRVAQTADASSLPSPAGWATSLYPRFPFDWTDKHLHPLHADGS
jgi:hypothetical protein